MDDVDGPIIAIVLRDFFSLEESLSSLSTLLCHKEVSVGWNKGCEADPRPTTTSINHQLTSRTALKSGGFSSSNVKQISHVGPISNAGAGACKLLYINRKGKQITRPLSSFIDRHKWNCTGKNSIKCTTNSLSVPASVELINKAKPAFVDNLDLNFQSRGCPGQLVKRCAESLGHSLGLSTLVLTRNQPIAVHRDPHPPCLLLFLVTQRTFSIMAAGRTLTEEGLCFYLMVCWT